MTDDEWQAHITREAAKAIGEWLEGRGGLHQPIRCLTMPDLEAMAQNAISTFIVKPERLRIYKGHFEDHVALIATGTTATGRTSVS
ncbi:MAG: hypothetical protein OJF62_002402 [Pseudolabrys sp.]|nr:hypothetical protein [Pseudolabrys sp.]